MFKKILVCIDGSAHAMKAAHTAVGVAKCFGSEVVLIDVLASIPTVAPYVMAVEAAPDLGELMMKAEHDQRTTLACVASLFQNEGILVRMRPETGSPVDVISQVAEDEHADLIVLGSRGIGSFQRFLLGSVSDGVAHHAHCPVLIVR